MNAPLDQAALSALATVSLDDKYTLEKGRAYMSGTQALVRLPMLQKQRDRAAGLNTAGFISGYRGSPLGALDQALWKAKPHLASHDIVFQPGLNEDLAATSVWGTQQIALTPHANRDGVFGMWYGKGPGVDRSMDVFKHANAAGTAAHGGVLVLAGDDHGAKSSTVAHQSEHDFISAGLPVLYPATVQEYLDFGLHGWAMSRYAGLWVAMKCVTEIVESTASVDIDPDRARIILPEDFVLPPEGLSIRWPDPPLDQEARLFNYKWYAALAYVRANKLNRVVIDSPRARLGIMTAGKAYLDTRQALAELGLDDDACAQLGIRLMKIGCVWPLNAQDAREFATGLEEILVVEEKRQILEYALKEELYNWREDVRPRVFGKFDEQDHAGGEWSVPRGPWLLPAQGELSPAIIARALARRLEKSAMPAELRARIAARMAILDAKEADHHDMAGGPERKPWFCSGCPHNTSTRVPEGSRALAGIGCHYMAIWMDRDTATFSHMGGEGAAWIGQHHFTDEKHIFANLGDGTYFHSGILAIRAAIASGANITYKILYNDAVAMTGGQPVDGVLKVTDVIGQVHAEGARKIVVVTDEPEKYKGVALAGNAPVFHRDELDDVQRMLREEQGTTVLVYDQTCATEKRRRRKRGAYPDPARRVFINEEVCEGCGDCSVKSNCLSVEPVETPRGTKRRINQSSCNKDFSCVNGFCPSFVTAEGAQMKKPRPAGAGQAAASAGHVQTTHGQAGGQASGTQGNGNGASGPGANGGSASQQAAMAPEVPMPTVSELSAPYGILVTGIGGTGVVTIGSLLGMAAHIEGLGVNVLDMAGLAQKGGAVLSHVQLAPEPEALHATRIATGEARLLIGCDAIVSSGAEVLSKTLKGRTHAIVNSAPVPTAGMIHNPKWQFPAADATARMEQAMGGGCEYIDAIALATRLLGDAIYANPLLLGYAWQKGWIPLTRDSLHQAMTLNDVAVARNISAFEWGRAVAHLGVQAIAPELAPADAAATAAASGSALASRSAPPSVTARASSTSQPRRINHENLGGARIIAMPESLDALIERNARWLTAYQNKGYARRYLDAVASVRAREESLGGGQPPRVTRAVATNLAKLMAYKDEYEVARLYTDPAFLNKLREQFEGEPGRDYTLRFHLAPPLLSRRNAKGELVKRSYGPWMMKAFGILTRFKGLRGTPADIFGYTDERRMERQLVQEYFALATELASSLDERNRAAALALATLPDDIRGYGHVKDRNVAAAQARRGQLLEDYRHGRAPAGAVA